MGDRTRFQQTLKPTGRREVVRNLVYEGVVHGSSRYKGVKVFIEETGTSPPRSGKKNNSRRAAWDILYSDYVYIYTNTKLISWGLRFSS